MSKLSKVQQRRFGGLIAILSGKEPIDEILNHLLLGGYIESSNHQYILTTKGKNEKDRLSILSGLMMEKVNTRY